MPRAIARGGSAALIAAVVASILIIAPKPLRDQPEPDAAEAVDVAWHVRGGDGFITTVENGRNGPSRYPPGFVLALLPFSVAPQSEPFVARLERGTRFYAALYVLISAGTAWTLGGALAGAIAALMIGLSPFARAEAALLMSDTLAAALTVALVPLLARPRRGAAIGAGLLIGVIAAIRLQGLVLIPAALLVVEPPLRRSLIAGLALPLLALAFYFFAAFGSPFRTGYGYYVTAPLFRPSYVLAPTGVDGPWVIGDRFGGNLFRWMCPCPYDAPEAAFSNLVFYPIVLSGLFWIFAPPPIALLGLWRCWTMRRTAGARFTLALSALTFMLVVTYHYQSSRFLAAPISMLAIYGCVAVANWMESYADTF